MNLCDLYYANADVFYLILRNLPCIDLLALIQVNKWFHRLLYQGLGRDIWISLWQRDLSVVIPEGSYSTRRNDYLHGMLGVTTRDEIIMCGYERRLLHCYDNLTPYPIGVMSTAFGRGNLELIKVLYDQKMIELTHYIDVAIRSGHLDIVKFCLQYSGVIIPLEQSYIQDAIIISFRGFVQNPSFRVTV
jgi:hypothetical protein